MKNYKVNLQNGDFAYLADQSYLAIKKETTAGVAVTPNVFIPLVSADIKTVVNHNVDRRMRGIDWKGADLIKGNRSHEGEVKIYGDADNIGYFLNMLMVKGSTTGDSNGYTHPFTVGNGATYTFEIKKGLYAQRFFGVRIEEMRMEFEEGQLVVTLIVKAMGQIGIGSVGVALTGAGMTSLVLDDGYDIAPNTGLVVGDVINVGGVDVTITSVNANGTTVGFASTTITASVGDAVYLKPQTVTQPTIYNPFYLGNVLVGIGSDASASATASASRSTATPIYDCTISFKNNLFTQNGSNRLDPVQIIPKTKEAQVSLKQLFTSAGQRQAFLDRKKQAITFAFLGGFIKSDFTTQEKLTLTFNNVKLVEHNNPIEVGELIVDEEKFEVLYDATDGQAMSASLINRTSTY